MTTIDDLLAQVPLDQLAANLGVDRSEVEQAVTTALPALVGGLHANAQDPAGAASLAKALAKKDSSLIDGGVDLAQVDTTDGEKIVKNIFGDNASDVVSRLSSSTPGGSALISKVMPMLAPIVMSFLAKQFGTANKDSAAAASETTSGSGGLGGLLGGLFGGKSGGSAGAASSAGGIDIGSILGGLMGGGSSSGAGGIDIGGMLGGLLGGGKR